MTWEQNIIDIESDQELARGEIVIVAYDYKQEKTIPIPQEWREKIVEFEGLKLSS